MYPYPADAIPKRGGRQSFFGGFHLFIKELNNEDRWQVSDLFDQGV
jgi:hypothetical protein